MYVSIVPFGDFGLSDSALYERYIKVCERALAQDGLRSPICWDSRTGSCDSLLLVEGCAGEFGSRRKCEKESLCTSSPGLCSVASTTLVKEGDDSMGSVAYCEGVHCGRSDSCVPALDGSGGQVRSGEGLEGGTNRETGFIEGGRIRRPRGFCVSSGIDLTRSGGDSCWEGLSGGPDLCDKHKDVSLDGRDVHSGTIGSDKSDCLLIDEPKQKKKKRSSKKKKKFKVEKETASDVSLGGKTMVGSIPEWRVSAKPLGSWALGASNEEKESLAKSLRKKWELENELKAQKLQRQLDLMNSDDLVKEMDTRRVEALARGERAKVSVEKAHRSLLTSGNVKGKVVVDVDGGGEVLGTVLESDCSISPNSSASMKEFMEVKKKNEELTNLLLRAGIDPDKELSPSGNTCYSRSLPAEGKCDPDGPFCRLSTRNREKLLAEGRPYRIDHSIAGSDGRCEIVFANIIEDDDFDY